MLHIDSVQLLHFFLGFIQVIAIVVLTFMVGGAIYVFIQALAAKRLPLRALGSDFKPSAPRFRSEVAAAIDAGFQGIGFWTDAEMGSDKGRVYTLMLTPDGCMLLRGRHDRLSPPYRLITQFADGQWLITTTADDESDLSGLDDEQMLPSDFGRILARHESRIARRQAAVVRFSPESIAGQLREHEQARVERLVAAGLARVGPGQEGPWRYTVLGALRLAWQWVQKLSRIQKMLAEDRKNADSLPLGP